MIEECPSIGAAGRDLPEGSVALCYTTVPPNPSCPQLLAVYCITGPESRRGGLCASPLLSTRGSTAGTP